MTRQHESPALPYTALALVAFTLLIIYGYNTVNFFHFMRNGQKWSRLPFILDTSDQIIKLPEPEAEAVHLRKGDRIVSLNGKEYRNHEQLLDALEGAAPGSRLEVGILRGGSTRLHFSVPLVALRKSKPSVALWAIVGFLRVLFPLLCLGLGFWVVLAKPHDKNAWFLLGIFSSFNILFGQGGLNPIHVLWLRLLVLFSDSTLSTLAFACIMLFGLYFPERSRLDRRLPWLKWSILAPMGGLLVLISLYAYDLNFDFHGPQPLFRWGHAVLLSEEVLGSACIFIFFTCIGYSLRSAPPGDARRRLRVLYSGSAIGLGGLLLLFILSTARGGMIEEILPIWLVFVVVAIPLLFPITLAYVVVVQRAMDVRILLRQGTKYAFARGTLWVLQFLFVAVITYRLARVLHEPRVSRNDIFILLVLGLTVLALRYRVARSISTWLDRKFFREAYSVEQVLSDLAAEVRNFTETRPLLETVTGQIGRTLHIEKIAVLLNNGGNYQLQTAAGPSASKPVLLRENSSAVRHLRNSRGPAALDDNDPDGWLIFASPAERETLRQLSAKLLLPLPGRKQMMGILALGPKLSEEPYSRADLQLLQSVAVQTGLAIENAELMATLAKEAAQRERMNREIEIAQEVQQRLFPQTLPEVRGGDCAGFCRPAQGVGGDYYDFIQLTSNRIGIAVGDVSGKGISAALVMASLRASLHGITLSGSSDVNMDLATLVRNINRLVHDSSTPSRYATFFFAEYDPHTRLLRYVNAGHNPPVILRPRLGAPHGHMADGCEILRLDVGGTVVGLLDDPRYETGVLRMRAGDVLVAFTDGISEAMNVREEEWGEERMIDALWNCWRLPAGQIIEYIFAQADAFTQTAPQHDDMTLTVLKLTEQVDA